MAPDEALGALEHPDADRERDPDQHAGREDVLDQAHPSRAADQRELEGRVDQLPHDLDDRGEQDQEPPEDQRVHQAGERALEELALREYLGALTSDPAGDVAAAFDRASEAHEPREQACPAGREPARDADQEREDRGSNDHRREHTRPLPTIGRATAHRIAMTETCLTSRTPSGPGSREYPLPGTRLIRMRSSSLY
jgi:hypothetical protein